ncbi:MAG: hypothetical protein AAFP76_14220 [Bacteroidota bacterium]
MDVLFDAVYRLLKGLSQLTGFTYQEINIIVYFLMIPSLFALLVDRIIEKHYFKIGFVVLSVVSLWLIEDFELFSQRLFDTCAVFLKSFGWLGLDYVQASVVICVFLPILFILWLIYFRRRRNLSLGK